MKIKLPNKNNERIQLPKSEVISALDSADGVKLKVLLSLASLSPEDSYDEAELCERLNITVKSFASAVAFWEKAGVIEAGSAPAKTTEPARRLKIAEAENVEVRRPRAVARAAELPKYSSDEIAVFVNSHPEYGELFESCQQYLGKLFNTAEMETVVGLLDYLKLDPAYILLLFSHCGRMDKKSLRYVEKLAIGLYDDGVMDYGELDERLKAIEAAAQLDKPLRKLFGIGRRALTKKEKAAFEKWCGAWQLPFPIIEKAYEVTVENTGSASVPYCNAVLENWHESGYRTLEDVEKALADYKHDKDGTKDSSSSFETNDFFEAALRRSYEENAKRGK